MASKECWWIMKFRSMSYMGLPFDKMKVYHMLTLVTSSLYKFTGDSIILRGKITLATKIRVTPLTAHKFMEYLMVDHRSAYNGVLRRPTLKELWAVTSIHDLCMKFPTKNGIIIVKGYQQSIRECYSNSVRRWNQRA